MGMEIAPAHTELENVMQPAEGCVTGHLDASPDKRIGEGQGYLQLENRGRFFFGPGLAALFSAAG